MIEINDIKARNEVIIGNKRIIPWKEYSKYKLPDPLPVNYKIENTTVWSFPTRGSWASHTPQYRGNWSPQVVRNLLELYSKPGDLVLDPMVGGGTTPVECYLTGRNSISVDINPDAISVVKDRMTLSADLTHNLPDSSHKMFIGDTRRLDQISDDSIDLILAHPPYGNIIKYTKNNPNDLSLINSYHEFFIEFSKAIAEYHRVLKPGKSCAVMIGDTHNKGHYVPISAHLLIDFLNHSFVLKEDIIKKEWNCDSSLNYRSNQTGILLTMHEHIFVFEKPRCTENRYLNSTIDFFQ